MSARLIVFILLVFIKFDYSYSQNILHKLLHESSNPAIRKVADNRKQYHVQIIYTQINRDKDNNPTLKKYTFGVNDSLYFYPASLVKLPTIALALEKIDSLNISGFTKYSRMQIDSAYQCQISQKYDSTTANNYPSIAHCIKKMLLVSDNNANNRLYEFMGTDYINAHLKNMGYTNAAIFHRLSTPCKPETNKITNPITFYDSLGNIVYKQPLTISTADYSNPLKPKAGMANIDDNGKFVKQPRDFSNNNYLPLSTINSVLISLIFPQAVDPKKRFRLTPDDYTFIYKYMSMYPRESDYPKYDPGFYQDNFKKYYESNPAYKTITVDSVRIFNIVGLAYGYMSDCSYIVDFDKKVEYFLSTSIYVNDDGIINDGKYNYKTIGFPFLEALNEEIYNYELHRKKTNEPVLSNFKLR